MSHYKQAWLLVSYFCDSGLENYGVPGLSDSQSGDQHQEDDSGDPVEELQKLLEAKASVFFSVCIYQPGIGC